MTHPSAPLFERYVRLLDDDRFDEWLELFTGESYYGVLTYSDYMRANRYMIIGESFAKLSARVRSGARLDVHRKTHLLTAISDGGPLQPGDEGEAPQARANFAYFKNGVVIFCGRYLAWFSGEGKALRIRKWLVVLDNPTVGESVFLPI